MVHAAPTARLLPDGVHVWLWPHDARDIARWDLPRLAAEMRALGLAGVLPQWGLGAPAWCTDARVRAFSSEGITVTAGLGMDGANGYHGQIGRVSDAILLACDRTHGCMENWESEWGDDPWDHADATTILNAVLRQRPDAAQRCTSAPWWAPLYYVKRPSGRRQPTHPSTPYAPLLALNAREVYVQAYGANVKGSPDGASARMLAWARDPSQYGSMGIHPGRVLAALQTYRRTVNDHLTMLLSEPVVCLWDWVGMDDGCRVALLALRALRRRGFTGPGAILAFQSATAGLVVDGVVGPKTCEALGVTHPPGTVFRRHVAP